MNAQPVSTFARGRSTALALILISCHAAAGPSAEIPHSAPESTPDSFSSRSRFSISAGWMWRETGGVHFHSGSRAPSLALPSLFGRALTTIPPIGTTNTFTDRFYGDGTVLMDAGTPLDGSTSAWSYQHEAQAEGGALLYHAQGHRRESEATRSALPPADQAFDGSGGVPVIELGWEKDLSSSLSLGARFQWSFLDFDGSHEQTTFSAWQQSREYTIDFSDRYDLQGVVPPQAPYTGAGLGFGPVINNQPTSRNSSEYQSASGEAEFLNSLHQSFEVKLNTLSLGPSLSTKCGPVSLQAGAGFALNIVDWEASQSETLYLSRDGGRPRAFHRWIEDRNDTDFLPGFYLQGGLTWHISSSFSINGFCRYDWSEALDEPVGPSTLSFDPGGWSAGVMAGWHF